MVGGDVSAVSVVGNVVQAKDETIVHIAQADAGLIELAGVDVVARRAQHHPIRVEFDLAGSQNALLTVENTKCRLGGIVAIEQAAMPAGEIDAGFELDTLSGKGVVVETEARRKPVRAVRLVRQPCYIIGRGGVEATVKAGIRGAAGREGVLA